MAPNYDESALAGQGVIASWQASELRGPFTATGGRLVLTERALIFSPLDLEGTLRVIKLVLETVELPGEQVLTQLAEGARKAPLTIALNNVASLEQTGGARLLTPPRLRLVTKVGSVFNFGVLAGIGFPNASKENEVAMADLLRQVGAQIPAAA
jgi:hypothetical protein